jgi:hypothetical protein
MSQTVLSVAAHTARAQRHMKVANALAEAGDEWAGVCFFYAAYHRVRAALIEDHTFDDLSSCQAVHADLRPEDKHISRHNGRKNTANGREWGVNDLVRILYPGASGTYERLHQISIDVRYGAGMRPDIDQLRDVWEKFERLCAEGVLTSARA